MTKRKRDSASPTAAAAACGTGTTVGIWNFDVDRIGAHARKLIDELFPMPQSTAPAAQDEGTAAPEEVSRTGRSLLDLPPVTVSDSELGLLYKFCERDPGIFAILRRLVKVGMA